jgi:hypothetical protein
VVEIVVSGPGIRFDNSRNITVSDNLLDREDSTLQTGEKLNFNFKSSPLVGNDVRFEVFTAVTMKNAVF